jgi:hypothetical protein
MTILGFPSGSSGGQGISAAATADESIAISAAQRDFVRVFIL